MLKTRDQTGLEARILASASASVSALDSGPFGLGLKLLASVSKFNSI